MLKKFLVVISACVLVACASEPNEKGFVGTGDFDTVEAAKTRVSLGLTYLKNGNFSQAKFNLDKALEFAPRSGEANFAMAFYYQQVGENQRAEEYYQAALGYSRNDPDVLNSYGAFLCKQGKYEKAKGYFLQAVDDKSYISTAETYENLAICTQSEGRIDEAITYFNSALNHQPTRASTLLYLAQLYTQKGEWEDAKRSLWKYERNASVNDESLWLAYQIAKGQNDLRASLEYAELLKRLYPDSENTKKALNLLGKFQPDMTVTKKSTSVIPSNNQNSNIDAAVLEQNQPQENIQAKNNRILVPVDNTPATTSEINTELQNNSDSLSAVEESQNELVDETQSVTQETLSSTEADASSDVGSSTDADLSTDVEVEAPVDTAPVAIQEELVSEAKVEEQPVIEEELTEAEMTEAERTEALLAETLNSDIIPEPLLAQEEAPSSAQAIVDTNDEIPFHIVQPKENLYRISLKYNVKIPKLLEWNNLEDASNIQTGMRLWVRDPNSNE